MQAQAYPELTTTQRVIRKVRARRVAFLAVRPLPQILRLVDQAPYGFVPEVIYLVGARPIEGWRTWALTGLPPHWGKGPDYFDGAHPVMRYHVRNANPQNRPLRNLEIQSAGTWFAGVREGYTPDDALEAWGLVNRALEAHSQTFPGAVMWNTPAATGRDLWIRSIPPGRQWPVLPAELRVTTDDDGKVGLAPWFHGQGRTETLDLDRPLEGLFEYDGRLMYAPLAAWGLPGGVPSWLGPLEARAVFHDQPHASARYLVRAQVPDGWPHNFGLLGEKHGNEGWSYPCRPGASFMTWCDGAEALLAHRAGWPLVIHEGLVWPRYTGKGPLASWANALIAMYGELEPPVGEDRTRYVLARAAVRSLILHTIGSLASVSHVETRWCATAEQLPAEYRRVARPEPAGGFTYPVDTPNRWAQMQHPELAASVWGRARARLCAGPRRVGALNLTAGRVVAFRTDAIYTTDRQAWGDDGRVGSFRIKRGAYGPFPAPHSNRELLELRAGLPDVV